MLRNHLHTYSSNKVNSIQYQISFFKKSFKYIRLWLPKCHFIHKAANTIYSSYIIFFSSHKIHFIKFYLYIIYYWSVELRVIAEGLPSSLSVLYTQQSRLYQAYPHFCNLTLQSKGWRRGAGNTKAASALFKNPCLPSSCGWRSLHWCSFGNRYLEQSFLCYSFHGWNTAKYSRS